MSEQIDLEQLATLQRECDLYPRLLELGGRRQLESFLTEALHLVAELAGARQGYLALQDDDDEPTDPRWWISHGLSEDEVRGVGRPSRAADCRA